MACYECGSEITIGFVPTDTNGRAYVALCGFHFEGWMQKRTLQNGAAIVSEKLTRADRWGRGL